MFFKNLCFLVLRTKVVLALEGLGAASTAERIKALMMGANSK